MRINLKHKSAVVIQHHTRVEVASRSIPQQLSELHVANEDTADAVHSDRSLLLGQTPTGPEAA
jgi:hypothetical protein